MTSITAFSLLALVRGDEWDLERILTMLAGAAVIFGGPLIKSILESRGKARTDAEKPARRTARESEAEGRRAFEELMRGREPSAPPLVAPPPVPKRDPARRDAPDRDAPDRTRDARPQKRPTKPLTEREELPGEPLSGAELDAEEGATDEEIVARAERRERAELARQQAELRVPEEIARAEYAAASSLREEVEPVPVDALRTPVAPSASRTTSAAASRPLLEFGPGADRRAALRRAFVVNEVLGPPVSERDSSDARAPLGVRG